MPVLGNYIRINIDPAAEPVFVPRSKTLRMMSGKATELSPRAGQNSTAYIFSAVTLRGIVKLQISAIVTDRNTGVETYIATPDKVMVFEP